MQQSPAELSLFCKRLQGFFAKELHRIKSRWQKSLTEIGLFSISAPTRWVSFVSRRSLWVGLFPLQNLTFWSGLPMATLHDVKIGETRLK